METQKTVYEVTELEQGEMSLFEGVLDRVSEGEPITLTREGKPVAMLVWVPAEETAKWEAEQERRSLTEAADNPEKCE